MSLKPEMEPQTNKSVVGNMNSICCVCVCPALWYHVYISHPKIAAQHPDSAEARETQWTPEELETSVTSSTWHLWLNACLCTYMPGSRVIYIYSIYDIPVEGMVIPPVSHREL